MLFWTILTTTALSVFVAARPTHRDNWSIDDLEVLNFALALEHLENAFYNRLDNYSQDDFVIAGLPMWSRGRWFQIRYNEQVHVKFITTAIEAAKSKTVKPCSSDNDVISFAKTSLYLETIGISAYNGALQYIQDRDYITIGGSISTVEARQAGWINSSIFKRNAWGAAFDIPLSFRQIYTMVVDFIESCPSENSALLPSSAMGPFPQLTIDGELKPGQKGRVEFSGVEKCGDKRYKLIIKTGFGELSAPLRNGGWFDVPKKAEGLGATFVFVTLDNELVEDDNIVAGPALVMFDSSSQDNDQILALHTSHTM